MQTGIGIRSAGNWDRPEDNMEMWSCGCTVVGSISPLNARCLVCGGVFKKQPKRKNGPKKGKSESPKIELVENNQSLLSENEEKAPCQNCNNYGEVKVFTQEWDRIKSHMAPCPLCYSQEWRDWSAGRKIIE